MMALSFPIARNNGGKFPAEVSDDVWIWIILDGCDERREGNVFAKFFRARPIHNEVARKGSVVGREKVHDGGIDGEELAGGDGAIEDFGEETRAGAVNRIAARHAEGDGFV